VCELASRDNGQVSVCKLITQFFKVTAVA